MAVEMLKCRKRIKAESYADMSSVAKIVIIVEGSAPGIEVTFDQNSSTGYCQVCLFRQREAFTFRIVIVT